MFSLGYTILLVDGTANIEHFEKATEKTNNIAYTVSLFKELHRKSIIMYYSNFNIHISYLDVAC